MEQATNKFHERYRDACFMDDTPWYIWNDAWKDCVESAASKLERRAEMLLKNDANIAHELLALANELRGSYEDNKQARVARDNSQRLEEADIF